MHAQSKIYVGGHTGMVGSAVVRRLEAKGFERIIGKTSQELDLRAQKEVNAFFEQEKPDYVFLAAARVGGIHANNTYRADFIYDNLMIASNVIHAAWQTGVKKLLFLGSSCIYPRMAEQPLVESALLSGYLEPSNEPYAIAKIAGIKLCEAFRTQHGCDFISAMPTNLYGPNDSYDLENSHVLPALLRKFHTAKTNGSPGVTVWGTGSPLREFLHVDDLADACVFLMEHYSEEQFVNVGSGEEISIRDLALLIKKVVGFGGALKFDSSKPDGTPRKLMSSRKIHALGWHHRIDLEQGVRAVYAEALKSSLL